MTVRCKQIVLNLPKQVCARPIFCLPSFKLGTNCSINRYEFGTKKPYIVSQQPIWEQYVPLPNKNSEQSSPKLPICEQNVPLAGRNSEQNSPKFVPE